MTESTQTFGADGVLTDVASGVEVLGTIVGAFVPGGQIAGIAITDLVKLAQSVVAGAPAAIAAFNDIKAAASGGAAPTDAQIAAVKAAVDAGDDQIQKDVQQLDDSGAA